MIASVGRLARNDKNCLSNPMGLPTAFAKVFLDPELNHGTGYFLTPQMQLAEAQNQKIKSVLETCELQPGMVLLDIGCGWGAALRHAATRYGVRPIGLTIEREQFDYAGALARSSGGALEVRLQRWEDCEVKVDRIICLNAFENFQNKDAFFTHCRGLLPAGGILVLLTVTATRSIFRVISRERIVKLATAAGFHVSVSPSHASDYIRTLECFVANLRENRKEAEAAAGSPHRYAQSLRFYTETARYLRLGLNDTYAFTMKAMGSIASVLNPVGGDGKQ